MNVCRVFQTVSAIDFICFSHLAVNHCMAFTTTTQTCGNNTDKTDHVMKAVFNWKLNCVFKKGYFLLLFLNCHWFHNCFTVKSCWKDIGYGLICSLKLPGECVFIIFSSRRLNDNKSHHHTRFEQDLDSWLIQSQCRLICKIYLQTFLLHDTVRCSFIHMYYSKILGL